MTGTAPDGIYEVLRFRMAINPMMVLRALPPGPLRVTAVRISADGDFACPCGQTVGMSVVAQVGAILTEDAERDPVYRLGRCPACGMALGDWVREHESPPPFPLDFCLPWVVRGIRDGMADREARTQAQEATAELWSRRFEGDGALAR